MFEEIRVGYAKLAQIIPEKQYYRYNDHWRFVTQRLCFLAALIVFLEAGFLIGKDTAADILGGKNILDNMAVSRQSILQIFQ